MVTSNLQKCLQTTNLVKHITSESIIKWIVVINVIEIFNRKGTQ